MIHEGFRGPHTSRIYANRLKNVILNDASCNADEEVAVFPPCGTIKTKSWYKKKHLKHLNSLLQKICKPGTKIYYSY